MRLGWELPLMRSALATLHGPLMVSGFLGTLIGLERAVAVERPWAYVAPLMTGLGALALIGGLPGPSGPLLLTLGSGALVAIFLLVVRRQPALFTGVMALAALVWLVGNVWWLAGGPLYRVVFWWIGFLLLTIAGERLELARLQRPSTASRAAFLAALGVFLGGVALAAVDLDLGARLAGLGMLAAALWLIRHDISRRTVRQSGLTRFIALCLLSGYLWLGTSGLLAIFLAGAGAGPRYDALLHAFFLGFVFAMIFGHAPIIFPAVLGLPMAFRRTFYAHLVLLHLTLLLRVTGDLADWLPGREWGGLLNVLVLALFLINTISSVRLPLRPVPPGK